MKIPAATVKTHLAAVKFAGIEQRLPTLAGKTQPRARKASTESDETVRKGRNPHYAAILCENDNKKLAQELQSRFCHDTTTVDTKHELRNEALMRHTGTRLHVSEIFNSRIVGGN